jgi:pantothenate kinase-related protein Tda10
MGDAEAVRMGDAPPILRMYWPEIDQIVERWQWDGRANSSLLCILRGVRGSGKSTFAALLELAVESAGMTVEICSSDDYFRSPRGFRFVSQNRTDAQAYCLDLVKGALCRRVESLSLTTSTSAPAIGKPT